MIKKYKLKTNIEEDKNKKRISLEVNQFQLWYLMLGLDRLKLVEELKKVTSKLSKELINIGIKEFGWSKRLR